MIFSSSTPARKLKVRLVSGLPELFGVADSRRFGSILVEHPDIIRKVHLPFPNSGGNHLKDLDHRTSRTLLVPVPSRPWQEHKDGDQHRDGADAVSQAPANFVLNVDKDGDCCEGPDADEEEEPVEEERHLGFLSLVFLVELVCSEARDARLEASGT